MKKKAINSYFYETFDEFKKNILSFFDNTAIYKAEIEKLITVKFNVNG